MVSKNLNRSDVENAWLQMNDLLGTRVIAVNQFETPNWDNPGVMNEHGRHLYILTPEEVVRFGFEKQTPNPSRRELIDRVLSSSLYNTPKTNNPNPPVYYLSRSVKLEEYPYPISWTEIAKLIPPHKEATNNPLLMTPMHRIGNYRGRPVIHYQYGIHSNQLEFHGPNSQDLLARLEQVGLKPIDLPKLCYE